MENASSDCDCTLQKFATTSKFPKDNYDNPITSVTRTVYQRALIDCEHRKERKGELKLKRGEAVEILSSEAWAYVRSGGGSCKQGFVRFECLDFTSLELHFSQSWFEGDGTEATRVLLEPGVEPGTFLVRRTRENYIAVTIRDQDSAQGPVVRHCKVYRTGDGKFKFYGNPSFPDVQTLIQYYSNMHISVLKELYLTRPYSPYHRIPPLTQINVAPSFVTPLKKIDEGVFGQLWIAGYGVPRLEVYMLKAHDRNDGGQVLRQAELLHAAWHPKVARLLAVNCSEGFLLHAKLPMGFLLDYLKLHEELRDVCVSDMLDVASAVCEGMCHLEKCGIVHRDLRAQNVMLGHKNDVQIAEFSLAVRVNDSVLIEKDDVRVPLRWTAPEALFQRAFSNKSDVWSFACLLFELFSYGHAPHEQRDCAAVLRFLQGPDTLENPALLYPQVVCPDSVYYQTMLPCWTRNPSLRPSFPYLLNTLASLAGRAQSTCL